MLLIKSTNSSPQRRFQVKHKFLHKFFKTHINKTCWILKNKKTISGRNGIAATKFSRKTEIKPLNFSVKLKFFSFIVNYGHYSTKIKEFSILKNLYNQENFLPQLAVYYPGFKLYPATYLRDAGELQKLIGQFIPLIWIPINMPVCCLSNVANNKSTYIRSSGSIGIRKRLDRHAKLISILLPSQKIKIFPIHILGFFSNLYNLEKNKIIEGGWGYFPSNKKKINVRGVAMNPVDHPNGGRTKAKQPELSPWGWIAKHNK